MKTIVKNIFLIIAILCLLACAVLVFTDLDTAKQAMGGAMVALGFHIFFWMIWGTTVDRKGP